MPGLSVAVLGHAVYPDVGVYEEFIKARLNTSRGSTWFTARSGHINTAFFQWPVGERVTLKNVHLVDSQPDALKNVRDVQRAVSSLLTFIQSCEHAMDVNARERLLFLCGDWPVFTMSHRLHFHNKLGDLAKRLVILPAQWHCAKSLRRAVFTLNHGLIFLPFYHLLYPNAERQVPKNGRRDQVTKYYMDILHSAYFEIQLEVTRILEGRTSVLKSWFIYFFEELLPLCIDYEEVCRANNLAAFEDLLPRTVRAFATMGRTNYRNACAALLCWIEHWKKTNHTVYSTLRERLCDMNEWIVELMHSQFARSTPGSVAHLVNPKAVSKLCKNVYHNQGDMQVLRDGGYIPSTHAGSRTRQRPRKLERGGMDVLVQKGKNFILSLARVVATDERSVIDSIGWNDSAQLVYDTRLGRISPAMLPPPFLRPSSLLMCQRNNCNHVAKVPQQLRCGHIVDQECEGVPDKTKLARKLCGRSRCIALAESQDVTVLNTNVLNGLAAFCGRCKRYVDADGDNVRTLPCTHIEHKKCAGNVNRINECQVCSDLDSELASIVTTKAKEMLQKPVGDIDEVVVDDEEDVDEDILDDDEAEAMITFEESVDDDESHVAPRTNDLYSKLLETSTATRKTTRTKRALLQVDDDDRGRATNEMVKAVVPAPYRILPPPTAVTKKQKKRLQDEAQGVRFSCATQPDDAEFDELYESDEELVQNDAHTYCIEGCKRTDENGMIMCDSCESWFHFQCVDVDPKQFTGKNKTKKYYCVYCQIEKKKTKKK